MSTAKHRPATCIQLVARISQEVVGPPSGGALLTLCSQSVVSTLTFLPKRLLVRRAMLPAHFHFNLQILLARR